MFRFVYDGCGDGYVIIDNFKVYVTDNHGVNKTNNDSTEIFMTDGCQLVLSSSSAIEKVQIYNTNGMLVGEYEGNNQYRQIICLEHLHKGLYIIKVQCSDSIVGERVVIN